jgi:hypothetical protein
MPNQDGEAEAGVGGRTDNGVATPHHEQLAKCPAEEKRKEKAGISA